MDKKTTYKTRSLLSVPIHNEEGKAIGVAQALNKNHKLDFTLMDEVFLEMMADVIGLMVGHWKRSEYYKSKYDNQKRVLNSLPSLWYRFLKDSSLNFMTRLEALICNLTSAARCVVFVCNQEQKEMWCASTHHYVVDHVGWRRRKIESERKKAPKEPKRLSWKLKSDSESIAIRVAMTGLSIECPSAYNNEYFNMNVDLDTKLPLLCVPIHNNVGLGRKECVGVIYLVYPAPVSFQTKKMLNVILRQVPTILHGAEAINSLNGLSIDAKVKEMNIAAKAIQSRVRGMLIRKKRREKKIGTKMLQMETKPIADAVVDPTGNIMATEASEEPTVLEEKKK